MPDDIPVGTATLGLSVAWINGPEVKVPVRRAGQAKRAGSTDGKDSAAPHRG